LKDDLWVEKYRPKKMSEIIGNEQVGGMCCLVLIPNEHRLHRFSLVVSMYFFKSITERSRTKKNNFIFPAPTDDNGHQPTLFVPKGEENENFAVCPPGGAFFCFHKRH
jgi:hypothetical protein